MSVSNAIATFLAARKQPRKQHRATHVDEQDGGRAGELLRFPDCEVPRFELDGRTWSAMGGGVLLPSQRVRQRALEVEVEGAPELVGHGRLLGLSPGPGTGDRMAAERVAAEPCEQLVEDALTRRDGRREA